MVKRAHKIVQSPDQVAAWVKETHSKNGGCKKLMMTVRVTDYLLAGMPLEQMQKLYSQTYWLANFTNTIEKHFNELNCSGCRSIELMRKTKRVRWTPVVSTWCAAKA